MLYISKVNDTTVEITDTVTNISVLENKNTLYSKYNKRVVEGLTFTPKKKKPKCTVTPPVMKVLDNVPIGQVILLRRNSNMGFEHCIKIKQGKNEYEFYNGGGKSGFFILTKTMLIQYASMIAVDIYHVDEHVAHLLKQEYNSYLKSTS